jgi:hypothetical protein
MALELAAKVARTLHVFGHDELNILAVEPEFI